MHQPVPPRFCGAAVVRLSAMLLWLTLPTSSSCSGAEAKLRAGAAVVDITPSKLPVRRNGGFLEAVASKVIDPLHARALVLDDGTTRLAIVVVDSCMVPRDLCDRAKAQAADETGLRPDHILIAATHTHSAPAAMDYCLGCRGEPAYMKQLPPLLARAIVEAAGELQPAELGSTVVDAPDHTNCRRWILRPDRMREDPFGRRSVRAHMHPGYQNPDFIGPAGPVDTALSILSVRTPGGSPIALLANYSMHYFGVGGGLSADYYGRFASAVAKRLAPGEDAPTAVAIMSQGTSGDHHWMDYSRPRRNLSIDEYTAELVNLAVKACDRIEHRSDVTLAMAERRLSLSRRLPDAERLAWAGKIWPDRTVRPRNLPEVYAEQAFFIEANPAEEIVLQALRIGELGITGIPCEVYGITGLKLKAQSPLERTFNMELANGGAGYIPPPEQHALGGYTTWPARSAGLEVEAEPKIVDTVLGLLEDVSARKRRPAKKSQGRYTGAVLADGPLAYWRLDEFQGSRARDATDAQRDARIEGAVAHYLSGPESAAFSLEQKNRALHLAGGHLEASLELTGADSTVELWFWNGLPADARDVTGDLISRGSDRLVLSGTASETPGRLVLGPLAGKTPIPLRTWNHVVFTRRGELVTVYLNGDALPEMEGKLPLDTRSEDTSTIRIGDHPGGRSSFEGKIDEVAIYDRALTAVEAAEHWALAGVMPPATTATPVDSREKPSSAADRERYAEAVRGSRPFAYWPLLREEGDGDGSRRADDASGNERHGVFETGSGLMEPASATPNFTGGRLRAVLEGLGNPYSVELWFRNELSNRSRPVTGYLVSRGADLADGAPGDSLGIGGTIDERPGSLFVFNGNARYESVNGRTPTAPGSWNHVVMARSGQEIRIYLNGRTEPDARGELVPTYPQGEVTPTKAIELFVGGRNDNFANFRGQIEEVAVYDRALKPEEIAEHYRAAGIPETTGVAEVLDRRRLESPPLTPEETVAATHVRDGYVLELVAAEPLVLDPVAIDWGPDGRLWVAEMADYPLGMDGREKPGGRVRFLEDADDDGHFDRSQVFVQGLNFPNGVMAWRDGVLVTAAPDITYCADPDGDGRSGPGEARVLYTGFLPGNQQLRVNGLRWGLDNWIHCASGGHHAGHGAGNVVKLLERDEYSPLGSRDLRIRPGDGLLEPLSGPSQFGRVRDDWGNWFGVQNSHPLWHYVLEDRHARRNPHVPAPDPREQLRVPSNPRVYTAKAPQKRFHSFRESGRFTSACGISIYRDTLLFGSEEGTTHAFTCEPFHNVVQHSVLTDAGVTFTATRAADDGELDFLASADRWCRPVMTRTGPDGALWVVDMYRYMIEHPQWLPDKGKEELRPFYRAGDDRGRIYRILREDTDARAIPRLAELTPEALVERLASENGLERDLAQRLLVEGADRKAGQKVVEALERMARSHSRPLARLHALSSLDGMNALETGALLDALSDAHPGIARLALRILEARAEPSPELVQAAVKLADSGDAKLRLQLAATLGAFADERAGTALGTIAVSHAQDRWLRAAVLSSAVPHIVPLSRAVAAAGGQALDSFMQPLVTVAVRSDRPAAVSTLLDPLLAAAEGSQIANAMTYRAAGSFLDAFAKNKTREESFDGIRARLKAVLQLARTAALDDSRPPSDRSAAIDLLARRGLEDREVEPLGKLLASSAPTEVQLAALHALERKGSDGALRPILAGWKRYLPDLRQAAAGALTGRTEWARALLQSIERGEVSPRTLSADERQRLVKHRAKEIASLATRVLASTVNLDREKALERYRPALKLTADRSRGEAVFGEICSKCHSITGDGKLIGPDLRSITDRSAEGLLASILTPNRAVEPRYLAYLAILDDGEVVNGLVAGETGNSLILQLADGSTRTVLRSAILELESSGLSLMPEGLEADLSLQDMADLVAFLQGLNC